MKPLVLKLSKQEIELRPRFSFLSCHDLQAKHKLNHPPNIA